MNNLGLIYCFSQYKDKEKSQKYIKDSAHNEYPFGQNNYGLINQFYEEEKIDNAIHFYERSSDQFFALAEYNLGYIKEKCGKYGDPYEYYSRASDHEDNALIYREEKVIDNRLEISKIFILCLTNLKLMLHFYDLECLNQDESKFELTKKYFIRSLLKLTKDCLYKFHFKCEIKKGKIDFSYLHRFILNHPLFNLRNQPNLDLTKIKITSKSFKNIDYHDQIQHPIKIPKDIFLYAEENHKLNDNDDIYVVEGNNVNEEIIFTSPNKLFDFIIKSKEFTNLFIDEIKEICRIMMEILYTEPYPILFGRIFIHNPKSKSEIKDINELFYEGLGLEEFTYLPK